VNAIQWSYRGGMFMCGRYLLNCDIRDIYMKYRIQNIKAWDYNRGDFYPSQNALIVLEDKERIITNANWGFKYDNKKSIVINARAETITSRPMFRNSVYGARCIIPANGFYEWKDAGQRKKVKYKIGLQDSNLISLGGIYRIYVNENNEKQLTFVIITTDAEDDLRLIHPRMPLIIKDKDLDQWLDKNTPIELIGKMLKSNNGNKLAIERCGEDGAMDNIKGENYEQLKLF